MQLFYVPDISGAEVILGEAESKHAVKVLRISNSDAIQLVDGKGGFYEAEVTDANPKKCRLSILNSVQGFGKRNFHLHIAIAPTKNSERFEWFLEKATEIGIDEITPLLTGHSERKSIKSDRLDKILVSAMKQSGKAYLPVLNEMKNFSELITSSSCNNKFIAHCNNGEKIHLKDVVKQGGEVLILIGPEGDFSPEEVTLARENGFQEISLGNSRLRTETAGVVACHTVNLAND